MATIQRALAAVAMIATLSGCLADVLARREVERQELVTQTAERVSSGQACCKSYQDMSFRALTPNTEQEIVLTTASPIYEFAFGKSRFDAFALPSLQIGDTLKLSAIELINGPSAKPIFRPLVLLLTEAFEPLKEQPALEFTHYFMGWSTEGHSAKVTVSADIQNAKYAVVLADPAYVGKSYIKGELSYMSSAGGALVPVSVPEQRFPYGYEGKAFIEIKRASN